MISHTRYNQIRERIFFLYNIINNRTYPVWVAPKSLMDLDQLRDRGDERKEGFANDAGYYDNPQLRKMTCPQMIDILPNLTGPKDLGFNNPNHVVIEIYESLQEYVALWCEMINNAPEFRTPPIGELRTLESLAWYLFGMYKQIKPFVIDNTIEKQMREDKALNRRGLMGMAMLFDYNKKKQELSFVSNLDGLQGGNDFITPEAFLESSNTANSALIMDSLSTLQTSDASTSEWLFRG